MKHSSRHRTTTILLFSLILLLQPKMNGALPDSCERLNFHSDLERKGFTAFCNTASPDFLLMASAVDPEASEAELDRIRNSVKAETEKIRGALPKLKKNAKKLKYIFDDVQAVFLKTYDLDAGFTDVFRNGKFNCLTATILYSIILEDLKIEHTAKFMPGHVYLVVTADETPFMFETTDPHAGFYEITSSVQTKAIQGLRMLNIITENKGSQKADQDLFDRYFIRLNNTEMRGLIGYLYTNLAIHYLVADQPLKAYQLIDKSYLLTPLDELTAFKEQLLMRSIVGAGKTTTLRAHLLADFYNYSSMSDKKSIVADEFKASMYQCLFSSFPAPDSAKPVYEELIGNIGDEDMKTVLRDLFILHYSEWLRTGDNPDGYFDFIYTAYVEGCKSTWVKSKMEDFCMFLRPALANNTYDGIAQYDSIISHYPALESFSAMRENLCFLLVNNAINYIVLGDIKKSLMCLDRYENENFGTDGLLSQCSPSKAYSLACSYYFKKGNTAKAKEMIAKGLVHDPENWELKKKRKELN